MKTEIIKLAEQVGFESKLTEFSGLMSPKEQYHYLCDLQKFLMDEKDLYIYPSGWEGGWVWTTKTCKGVFLRFSEYESDNESGYFKTYELALEAGILEVLKELAK